MKAPDQPPWQVRLTSGLSAVIALTALFVWDSVPAFFVIALIGIVASIVIENGLSPNPDTAGVLALKVVGLFSWGAVLIGGVVGIIEWISPVWLAVVLVFVWFASNFVAIKRLIAWEEARAGESAPG